MGQGRRIVTYVLMAVLTNQTSQRRLLIWGDTKTTGVQRNAQPFKKDVVRESLECIPAQD